MLHKLLGRKAALEDGIDTLRAMRPRTAYDAVKRQRIVRDLGRALSDLAEQLAEHEPLQVVYCRGCGLRWTPEGQSGRY